MGEEIDLLVNYPRAKRDVDGRGATKTEEDRATARLFGREFFDGDRRTGYGGFSYHPRFWQPTIPVLQKHFGLTSASSVLDVGCAKGFMLYDLSTLIPGIEVQGVDISSYAIEHAIDSMRLFVQVADARSLPFAERSFDVVISINTIHNLELDGVKQSLREIERVKHHGAFVTVDAYRTVEEQRRMTDWNLTARTILSVDDWKQLFDDVGYTGDYYWFIP